MSCGGSAFVTMLSGDKYVSGALCLQKQLQRVGSACPLVLVLDDRPGFALSEATQEQLQQSFGGDAMLPLSYLTKRVAAALENRSDTTPAFRDWVGAGGSSAYLSTSTMLMLKLYLWALPRERFERVAILDLDLLILQNVDHLLNRTLYDGPLLAVGCGKRRGPKHEFFNSGVMVVEPNLEFAIWALSLSRFVDYPWRGYIGIGDKLDRCAAPGCSPTLNASTEGGTQTSLRFLCAYTMRTLANLSSVSPFRACLNGVHIGLRPAMSKACEPGRTDQSVINRAALGRWKELSGRLNVPWHMTQGAPTPGRWGEYDIIHFVSHPKPWADVSSFRLKANQVAAVSSLSRIWTEGCQAHGIGPLLRAATGRER